jgi:glycosyltransferase involved in cell wall biosynthesis
MVIGIDGNEANVDRRVGIGEYAFELIKEFQKLKGNGTRFVIYLKKPPMHHMPPPTSTFSYKVIGPKKLWTQFGLPVNLYLGKRPDVFFTPSHYAPRFSPIPTAISVMDMSFIFYPELFLKKDLYQLTNWTKYSVIAASAVFTISNSSKDDIIKTYGIDSKKVHVTYPGIKIQNSKVKAKNMEELRKKFGIKKEYILFVGTLQPRKNIERLVEAFSLLKGQETNILQLLIVGKRGWQYEEILRSPKKYGVEDKVKFLDFVEDNDLSLLYKNAVCFVLPSLYEGFGLPVLEAMKNGCPVLTSNVSSLPEAGGDAALYFDPNSAEDIARQIEKVIKDESLRASMVEKGKAQARKFSWEKTAAKTLKVLESL